LDIDLTIRFIGRIKNFRMDKALPILLWLAFFSLVMANSFGILAKFKLVNNHRYRFFHHFFYFLILFFYSASLLLNYLFKDSFRPWDLAVLLVLAPLSRFKPGRKMHIFLGSLSLILGIFSLK
jgi:hypothetical protein